MRTELDTVVREQFLSFIVAGGTYATPILTVREILQLEDLTVVPGAPPSVRGVVNVRGSVIPVVDLALKFGLGETRPTRRTCILVAEARLESGPMVVGLLADAVSEVLALPAEDIVPPPQLGGAKLEFLTGMGKLGRGFALLIDLDRVLAAEEKALAAELRETAARLPAPDAPAAITSLVQA